MTASEQRTLARLVAEEVLELLAGRGIVRAVGVSPRGKGAEECRGENQENESLDLIDIPMVGSSSLSTQRTNELRDFFRRGRKQTPQSGRSKGKSASERGRP